ncbi:uncharacterized protein LOC121370170 [Gigantopelta aegis]|uniref:uncharacterized protein LOC121370170 n=1 Tax=Gigantopelta aegis TaxID=1735272 RepID=UPI001B887BEF|nr:uncharacterized protein LOC121370170 [Gigantopelta aegis]
MICHKKDNELGMQQEPVVLGTTAGACVPPVSANSSACYFSTTSSTYQPHESPQCTRSKNTCHEDGENIYSSLQSWYVRNYPLPPKKIFSFMEKKRSLLNEDDPGVRNEVAEPLTLNAECDLQPSNIAIQTNSSEAQTHLNDVTDLDSDTRTYTVLESRSDIQVEKHCSDLPNQHRQQFLHTCDVVMDHDMFVSNGHSDSCHISEPEAKINYGGSDQSVIPSPEPYNEVLIHNLNNCRSKAESGYVTNIPCDANSNMSVSDDSPSQSQYSYYDWNMLPTNKKKKPSSLSSGSYLSSVSSSPSPQVPDDDVMTGVTLTKAGKAFFLEASNSSIFKQKYFPLSRDKIDFESSLLSKILPQHKNSNLAKSEVLLSALDQCATTNHGYSQDDSLNDSTSMAARKVIPADEKDVLHSARDNKHSTRSHRHSAGDGKHSAGDGKHSAGDGRHSARNARNSEVSDRHLDGEDLDTSCKSEDISAVPASNEVKMSRRTSTVGIQSDELCQVCGDVAAGFYCGAFICEACKKFFVRTCKQDKVKYACHKNQCCKITKENRIRCQYCRYQKCLSVNMQNPADHQTNLKPDVSNIPCRVCGGPSSGFHFGALTCEGCKGFFRRMVKERSPSMYQCLKDNDCNINMFTRNICKSCRYKKCTEVGMSVEGSRIGRQPNSVKHAISLEANNLKPSDNLLSKSCNMEGNSEPDDVAMDTSTMPSEDVPVDQQLVKIKQEPLCLPDDMKTLQTELQLAIKNFSELTREKFTCDISKLSTMEGAWDQMMDHLEVSAKCTITFAKKVPGFKSLVIEDQILLMQLATYPISLLNFACQYDVNKGDNASLCFTRAEEKMLVKFFPMLNILPAHHNHIGFMMKHLGIDPTELSIMCALILFCDECEILKENWKVKEWHDYYIECLQEYTMSAYTDGETRFGALLLRLGELTMNSMQHNKTIMTIIASHPHLQVNILFKEIFAV